MYSKRIDKIVSKIPQCDILADIGCDHGYIGVSALKQGVAKKCLFSDISAPSLNKSDFFASVLAQAKFFIAYFISAMHPTNFATQNSNPRNDAKVPDKFRLSCKCDMNKYADGIRPRSRPYLAALFQRLLFILLSSMLNVLYYCKYS